MALTLTRTEDRKGVMGNLRYEALDVAYDSSYPNTGTRATSGEDGLNPAALGMDAFFLVLTEQRAGYTFDFDYTNNRLHAFRTPANTHVLRFQTAAAANAVTAAADALRTAAAAFNVAGVDGTAEGGVVTAVEVALSEVANTTNLATALAQVRVFVVGR